MAAMDDTPSVNEGQSWSSCSDSFGFKCSENEDEDDESENEKNAKQCPTSDAMKLRKEDRSLFGFCPSWDEFYLVVCEVCDHVVKPQALKSHIELRHSITSLSQCERSSVPVQQGKNFSTLGKSSSSISMPLVTGKTTLTTHGVKPASSTMPPGHSSSRPPLKVNSGHSHGGLNLPSGQANLAGKPKPEGNRPLKNHTIEPVVRVERIPSSLMMKKVTSLHSPVNLMVTDKKELPSPQQPPPPSSPLTVAVSSLGQDPGTLLQIVDGGAVGHSLQTVVADVERSQQPLNKKAHSVSSKSKKASKERKLLPCKDREYDPNKHCGVIVVETGKPCTRSLTCKAHSLSMRRAVAGRKKIFDELLNDHRAAKEASLRAQGKLAAVDHGGGESHNSNSSSAVMSKSCFGSSRLNSTATIQRSSSGSALKSSKSSKSTSAIPFNRSASSPGSGSVKEHSEQAHQRLHGDSEDPIPKISYPDPPYVNHHPKPAALCTFGMRQLGNGLFLLNRHWDLPRSAFRSALFSERGVHPPPLKKLCLESRLPPVPETVDPSDPYRFTCMEASTGTAVPSANANPPRNVSVAKPTVSTLANPSVPVVPKSTLPIKSKPTSSKVAKLKESLSASITRPPIVANSNNVGKKRRTSAVNCASSTPVSSQTVTLTAVTSAGHTLPLSFPLTIGDHLGTLSRYQVSAPLVMGRNSLSLPTAAVVGSQATSVSTSPTGANKEGSVIVTGVDMLNGQLPVTTALLHSVTVNRSSPSAALLATTGGGLGITLSGTGLVGQLSQLQQSQKLAGALNSSASSPNKNGASSANWSTRSAKLKARGSRKSAGNKSVPNHATLSSSLGVGLLIEGPAGGGLLTMGNSANNSGSANSHSSPSPSTSPSPLLRTDSIGSQVSSPMANGLGLSPPVLAQKIINSTLSIHPPTSVSPASRTSTPSPGTDLSSPGSVGSGTKGKGIASRLASNYQKAGTHSSLPFPVGPSISVSALPVSAPSGGRSSQPITYQQVFASQMLTPEQLGQLHVLPTKQNKIPLLATPAMGLPPQLFVQGGEDSRRTEDSHSLST